MTALPVLFRDVRTEARRTTNYWLRLLAATLMIVVFWGLIPRDQHSAAQFGARLFPYLHSILLLTLWVVTPLLTSDCLAWEKREGTLPLLLLTRLTPCAVVTAMMLVHLLRGLTLMLAALPLLCLPFLTGGVSPEEIKTSVLLCCSVLALGLTGGIVGSALCQSWARASVVALIVSSCLILLFASSSFWGFQASVLSLNPNATGPAFANAPGEFLAGAFSLLVNSGGRWLKLLTELPPGGSEVWVALLAVLTLGSVLASVLLVQWSGRIVRRTSVEGPGAHTGMFAWLLASRFWSKTQKRQRRMQLRRNPNFWLQQRTWSARATRWGWCLGVLLAELLLSRLRWQELWITGQVLLGLFLVFGLIYASALSYREEKRIGMLELILVTPLPVWLLVTGRIRSLWRQFLPAFLCWASFACFLTPPGFFTEHLVRAACVAFTILLVAPIVGLGCAISIRGHWRAVLATSALVLLVPGTFFFLALGDGLYYGGSTSWDRAFRFALDDGWGAVFQFYGVLWIIGILITRELRLQMKDRRLGYLHPYRRRRRSTFRLARSALRLARRGSLRSQGLAAPSRASFPTP